VSSKKTGIAVLNYKGFTISVTDIVNWTGTPGLVTDIVKPFCPIINRHIGYVFIGTNEIKRICPFIIGHIVFTILVPIKK
jgi:hypothetical protein